MRWRELGTALIVAFSSVMLVLGSLSISLVEFIPQATSTPTFNLPPSPLPVTATITLDASIPTLTFTATNTVLAPITCQPPAGWIPIVLQPSDTLDSLAILYREDRNVLSNANCLVSDSLLSNTLFYVPPQPTSTFAVCVPGGYVGWAKKHVVIKGDTLYSISLNYYTIVDVVKQVNCKFTDQINIGEILWVPDNVSTRTPIPTPLPGVSPTAHPTDPLTQTALPFTATVPPTNTPIPNTPTPIPTLTASPTAFGNP